MAAEYQDGSHRSVSANQNVYSSVNRLIDGDVELEMHAPADTDATGSDSMVQETVLYPLQTDENTLSKQNSRCLSRSFYREMSPNYASYLTGSKVIGTSDAQKTEHATSDLSYTQGFSASTVVSIGTYYNVFSSDQDNGQCFCSTKPNSAADIIAGAVELRLRIIIQEALQFQRHSLGSLTRQNVLSFSNIIDALEAVHMRFNADVDVASTFVLGAALGSSAYADTLPPNVSETTAYFPPDIFASVWNLSESFDLPVKPAVDATDVVCTQEYANAAHAESNLLRDKLPTLTLQWIAVDGRLVCHPRNRSAFSIATATELQGNAALQTYHVKLRSPGHYQGSRQRDRAIESFQQQNCLNITAQTERVDHALSQEHFLLLTKLQRIFREPFCYPAAETAECLTEALSCIQSSPGLRQLAPYLIHFACQQIYTALASPGLCVHSAPGIRTMLRVLKSLLQNPSLQLHLFAHQMTQAIQTVVLHPFLGCKSMTIQESSALRYFAATTLAFVMHHFATLHGFGMGALVGQTIVAVYRFALNADQPLPTLLGTVIGLRCLGQRALQTVLLPVLPAFAELLQLTTPDQPLEAASSTSSLLIAHQFRIALSVELLGAIADAIGVPSGKTPSTEQDLLSLALPLQPAIVASVKDTYESLVDVLGDNLIPFFAAGLSRNQPSLSPETAATSPTQSLECSAENTIHALSTTL